MGAVFLMCAVAALVWLIFAASMRNPRYLSTRVLRVGKLDEEAARRLGQRIAAVRGVAEAVVIAADEVAYLKYDQHALDEEALNALAAPEA
jgi:hypothetical protein